MTLVVNRSSVPVRLFTNESTLVGSFVVNPLRERLIPSVCFVVMNNAVQGRGRKMYRGWKGIKTVYNGPNVHMMSHGYELP